jgi:DNA-directed RNA polymerase subunit K/omega
VIRRPDGLNAFEFVVLSGLRAAQLLRGCTPRLDGSHKVIMMAQMEIAAGKVERAVYTPVALNPVPEIVSLEVATTV